MLLQIYRDALVPGREAEYRAVEEDAAKATARLGFPNPHLAMEALGGPKEVWWINAFDSEDHRRRVIEEYEKNRELVAALLEIGRRKQGLIGTPKDVVTTWRPDLSLGRKWDPAGARFVVAVVTGGESALPGAVYEAPDGTRFILRTVATLGEADKLQAAAGLATVFAIRPYWGLPAKEWIAADPEFWKRAPP
ncbi:MAG: hypothetical protein ACRENB_10965 [Gemmatimonadales bacterium]